MTTFDCSDYRSAVPACTGEHDLCGECGEFVDRFSDEGVHECDICGVVIHRRCYDNDTGLCQECREEEEL